MMKTYSRIKTILLRLRTYKGMNMADHEFEQFMKYMRYIVALLAVVLVGELAALITTIVMVIQNTTIYPYI
jgi:hypothetical protein